MANRAAELAGTVRKKDRAVLITAAWLHDIGYSPDIQYTGFHPLDGGRLRRNQAATIRRRGPRSVVPGRILTGRVTRNRGYRMASARNAAVSSIRAKAAPRQ